MIERQEIVIGDVVLVSRLNVNPVGVAISRSATGMYTLSLPASKRSATGGVQQAWFSPIDNLSNITYFGTIDVKPVGDNVEVSWTYTQSCLLRIAVYMAY
jgi:hypothetical protein